MLASFFLGSSCLLQLGNAPASWSRQSLAGCPPTLVRCGERGSSISRARSRSDVSRWVWGTSAIIRGCCFLALECAGALRPSRRCRWRSRTSSMRNDGGWQPRMVWAACYADGSRLFAALGLLVACGPRVEGANGHSAPSDSRCKDCNCAIPDLANPNRRCNCSSSKVASSPVP